MKKVILFLCLLVAVKSKAQKTNSIDVRLAAQLNLTAYDEFKRQNSSGAGAALELGILPDNDLHPILELNANIFGGTKEMTFVNGKAVEPKHDVYTLFGGLRYAAGNQLSISLTNGAAFYNGETHYGLRTGVNFYFTKTKRASLNTSFTHIFDANEIDNTNFGYVSFGLGIKLF